jgi:hypothetical protein
MSPTLEKVKPARRSRLERIDAALVDDEAKLAAAKAKIAELQAAEDDAVVEAKRRDPSANPFALREPAQVARSEREKLERSLDGIAKGLAALKAERVIAAREEAARQLVDHIDEGRDLLAREREQRLAAGKLLTELAETWEVLRPILERRSELHRQVAADKLLDRLAGTEAEHRWTQVGHFAIEPVPATFGAFVEELLEDALGDRRDLEAEREDIAAMNVRRKAFDQPLLPPDPTPLSRREEEVAGLVPDLRDVVGRAEVSGVAVRRTHASEVPWPDRAA